jgi:hypothetical protein
VQFYACRLSAVQRNCCSVCLGMLLIIMWLPRWKTLNGVIMSTNWRKYSVTPIVRTLVIRIADYPDRLGPSGNFDANSAKLICLGIIGYWIEYSTVKCYGCLEIQIRCCRKVWTQVLTVNSNNRRASEIRRGIPNCQIHIRNYVLMFYFYVNKYVA